MPTSLTNPFAAQHAGLRWAAGSDMRLGCRRPSESRSLVCLIGRCHSGQFLRVLTPHPVPVPESTSAPPRVSNPLPMDRKDARRRTRTIERLSLVDRSLEEAYPSVSCVRQTPVGSPSCPPSQRPAGPFAWLLDRHCCNDDRSMLESSGRFRDEEQCCAHQRSIASRATAYPHRAGTERQRSGRLLPPFRDTEQFDYQQPFLPCPGVADKPQCRNFRALPWPAFLRPWAHRLAVVPLQGETCCGL